MSQAAPLALTDAAHTEQKGWRGGQHLVDSLPYVDSLTPTEKAAVDKLIEEEVRSPPAPPCIPPPKLDCARPAPPPAPAPPALTARLPARLPLPTSPSAPQMRSSSKKPGDYLGELPPLPDTRFAGDPLLEQELARVAAGEGMQAMDTARYSLDPPPPTKRNDYASWRSALDNAYAQLEHQYNRWVGGWVHGWEGGGFQKRGVRGCCLGRLGCGQGCGGSVCSAAPDQQPLPLLQRAPASAHLFTA